MFSAKLSTNISDRHRQMDPIEIFHLSHINKKIAKNKRKKHSKELYRHQNPGVLNISDFFFT